MSKKTKKIKQESYKKRFFRETNPLLRESYKIIKKLVGTDEEKLGQFSIIEQTQQYKEKYPNDLKRKDISYLVRAQLGSF